MADWSVNEAPQTVDLVSRLSYWSFVVRPYGTPQSHRTRPPTGLIISHAPPDPAGALLDEPPSWLLPPGSSHPWSPSGAGPAPRSPEAVKQFQTLRVASRVRL